MKYSATVFQMTKRGFGCPNIHRIVLQTVHGNGYRSRCSEDVPDAQDNKNGITAIF